MGFIEVLVITFVVILTICIISTIISQRKFRRELKSQMEDINRRQMDRATEEAQRIQRWADPNFGSITFPNITDGEKKIEPTKHIKRHSIR